MNDVNKPEREEPESPEVHLYVESGFGIFNKRGFVKFTMVRGDERMSVFLRPQTARDQADYIRDAAYAAENDELLYKTFMSIGADEERASMFLRAMRKARAELDDRE